MKIQKASKLEVFLKTKEVQPALLVGALVHEALHCAAMAESPAGHAFSWGDSLTGALAGVDIGVNTGTNISTQKGLADGHPNGCAPRPHLPQRFTPQTDTVCVFCVAHKAEGPQQSKPRFPASELPRLHGGGDDPAMGKAANL